MRRWDGAPASEFAAAKELARTVVDGLSRSDELMIVAFDARAEVLQSFTPDTDRLREALDSLEPRDLTSHIADALEIAASFARASRGFDPEIVILSDGCVEEGLPATSFPVQFAKVGTASANQGVTALTVTRTVGETAQVLARIENADTVGATRNVVLRKGTEDVDARQIDLEPGGDATVMFDLKDADDAKSEDWSVALDGSNSLAADDRVPFIARPAVDRFGSSCAAKRRSTSTPRVSPVFGPASSSRASRRRRPLPRSLRARPRWTWSALTESRPRRFQRARADVR